MMNRSILIFILINICGGVAVLGSYAYGLLTQAELRGQLWGAIPDSIRPYYTVCMLSATIGYFFFTGYILLKVTPETARIFRQFDFNILNLVYAGIMIPSALWMPITFSMLTDPSGLLWVGIRIVLFTVGVSSVTLLLIFFYSNFERSSWLYAAGIAGLIPFCIQTMILDALIWPYYFPR